MIGDLLPQHQRLIEESAISPEVARARGYRSVTEKAHLKRLGFSSSQLRVPALLIPIHDIDGKVVTHQIRPDEPRVVRDKPVKYETPAGSHMVIDVPPPCRPAVGDPTVDLYITEGSRKADAAASAGLCCLALNGVYGWRGTNAAGGKTALADWESIALNGRRVYIVFDSDVTTKPEVRDALTRLAAFLRTKRAVVSVVRLPPGPDGSKVGIDDYLAQGNSAASLEDLAGEADRSLWDADPQTPPDAAPLALADYLTAVEALVRRYVALPTEHEPVAIALWDAHAHLVEHFETSPILAVTSAEMRSGKTRTLDVLELIVPHPFRVITPSEAVVYTVLAQRPRRTMLLDEADAIFNSRMAERHEGLRAILNAGNRKGTPVLRVRMSGQHREVEAFDVYGPKAIAGIGNLPDTVTDRAIPIRLKRRAPHELVARFRSRTARAEAKTIALDTSGVTLVPDVPVPEELNDRAADSWEPLIAVAQAAGGSWPERARRAALALSGEDEAPVSVGMRLLADIQDAFGSADHLATNDLLQRLHAMDDAPWGDWYGSPLSARGLAKLLGPYRVGPTQRRVRSQKSRGYFRTDFMDLWARYAPAQVSRDKRDIRGGRGEREEPLIGP